MSDQTQLTVKLPGYRPVGPPPEDDDTKWWRNFLAQIVFGIWSEKKEQYEKRGWSYAKPKVHQDEIIAEALRRVKSLKDAGVWDHKEHKYNWIDRRIEEAASEKFGPRNDAGILKIVNTTGGYSEPNPELFEE